MLTGSAYERLMSRYLTRGERDLLERELRARDRVLRARAPRSTAPPRSSDADADLQALAVALLTDSGVAARITAQELCAALQFDRHEFGPVACALEDARPLRAEHVLASLAIYRRATAISAKLLGAASS